MNTYPQEIYSKVENLMKRYPETRDSDIKLYKLVLLDFYGTTDLSKIDLKADIFTSIKRTRQKIQQNNPYLRPSKKVQDFRNEREIKFKEFARLW